MGDSEIAEAVYQMGVKLDTNKEEVFSYFRRAAKTGYMKVLHQEAFNCKGGIWSEGIRNKAIQQLKTASNEKISILSTSSD